MEKLKKEKEVCGIYISGNPLDTYLSQMINYTFHSTMIQEGDDDGAQTDEMTENNFVSDIKDGMQVECGGVLSVIKKIMTKIEIKKEYLKYPLQLKINQTMKVLLL